LALIFCLPARGPRPHRLNVLCPPPVPVVCWLLVEQYVHGPESTGFGPLHLQDADAWRVGAGLASRVIRSRPRAARLLRTYNSSKNDLGTPLKNVANNQLGRDGDPGTPDPRPRPPPDARASRAGRLTFPGLLRSQRRIWLEQNRITLKSRQSGQPQFAAVSISRISVRRKNVSTRQPFYKNAPQSKTETYESSPN
jgi:hypothetical protein